MFRNWTVMEDNNGRRSYFYGPLSEFEEEELEGLTVIPEENYSSDDMVEIFGNILEDNNYHRVTSLGNDMLRSLRETTSLNEDELRKFFKAFISDFIATHNLR